MAFSKRDLALLLPDSLDTRAVADGTALDPSTVAPLQPRIDPGKKVTRYFPGKAPKWAEEEDDGFVGRTAANGAATALAPAAAPSSATVPTAPSSSAPTIDPRLARLQGATAGGRRRRPAEARVVSDSDSDSDRARRVRVQARAAGAQSGSPAEAAPRRSAPSPSPPHSLPAALPAVLPAVLSVDDAVAAGPARGRDGAARAAAAAEAEEADSEYETASSEEEEEEEEAEEGTGAAGARPLLKPLFVPKESRVTIQEREQQEAEEEAREAARLQQLEARKTETRQLVVERIRQEEELAAAAEQHASDIGAPPDDDDSDEEEAFEAWRLRELKRLKRDREEREAALREAAETERRRNLTEEERAAEDKLLEAQGLKVFQKEKAKWNYLQKYYHKGAFFMDEDSVKAQEDVRKRRYDAPTGMDVVDRAKLPEVLQVKNFGFKGRTKWTHLSKEDTSSRDHPWFSRDNPLQHRVVARMGGVHGDLDTAGRVKRGTKRPPPA